MTNCYISIMRLFSLLSIGPGVLQIKLSETRGPDKMPSSYANAAQSATLKSSSPPDFHPDRARCFRSIHRQWRCGPTRRSRRLAPRQPCQMRFAGGSYNNRPNAGADKICGKALYFATCKNPVCLSVRSVLGDTFLTKFGQGSDSRAAAD